MTYRALVAQSIILLLGWVSAGNAAPGPTSEEVAKFYAATNDFQAAVESGDWERAATQLQRAGEAAQPAILTADERRVRLAKLIIRAVRAVRDHDRPAAHHSANKLFEWMDIVAHPELPPEIFHLEYVGREMQIGSSSDHPKRLTTLTVEARQAWERLKPFLAKDGQQIFFRDGDALFNSFEHADDPLAMNQLGLSYLNFVRRIRKAVEELPRQ